MADQNVQLYCNELTTLGIENKVLEHPTLKTKIDVLNYLHLNASDCIPTLIMKADDKFIAVALRGDCKVDFKKVKKEFGIKDLRMATPDEFTNLTHLPIGAARVYTPEVKMTVIDNKVFEKDYLTGGSGGFNYSINYKTSDLKKLPNSITANISQSFKTL